MTVQLNEAEQTRLDALLDPSKERDRQVLSLVDGGLSLVREITFLAGLVQRLIEADDHTYEPQFDTGKSPLAD